MAAVEQLITENLDVWSSAVKAKSTQGRGSSKKIDLYGIKKLRELILELAVRGLLVPQCADDEPAIQLLEQISVNRQELIKNKKIKKPKVMGIIKSEAQEFSLPNGWEWERLGNIINVTSSKRIHARDYTDTGIPFYRSKEIGELQRGHEISTTLHISEEKYEELKELQGFPRKNDLMLTSVGTIGNTWISDGRDFYYKDGNITKLDYNPLLIMRYVELFIKSPFFKRQMTDKVSGTAYSALTIVKLNALLLAVPPKVEQNRIVTKVDELMALCDQLEQQQENSISAHQTLVETLLNALVTAAGTPTQSADKTESAFDAAWARIAEHFDTLFTTENSIAQLKQTLLQLAVMGKLVPQNPNDEPASVLLQKIALEKAQLIKDKKIKKQKDLPPISEDEKLFALPEGWEWARIAELALVGTGGTPARDNPDYFQPAVVNWVTSGETGSDFVFKTKEQVSLKAVNETNVSIYPTGTLIVAMYGQGKTRGQITELMVEAGTNQACAAIQLVEHAEAHRKYIKLYFKKAYEELRSHAAGGAQPNLNVGKISLTVIPVPPLAEEQRIAVKIDELFGLCDTLKSGVGELQAIQLHLSDVIAENALKT